MMQQETKTKIIAYPWLCGCIIFSLLVYWIFSLALIFKSQSIQSVAPLPRAVYYSFFKQNWHLFADTRQYNRELYLILNDSNSQQKNDSIALVKYIVAQKRKHAPFNNFEDATDHLIYRIMNGLEQQIYENKILLQKQFPDMSAGYYLQQSSMHVEQDSLHKSNLQNLESFGKYVLQQNKITTTGKLFKLVLVYHYIQPPNPQAGTNTNQIDQTIFTSTFKKI